MNSKVKTIDTYILENKKNVNSTYRHKFHLMGEMGWINDPNGFCKFKNTYHLFYQHNPFSSVWGPMHWGHATSMDLIKWQWREIALAPTEYYDRTGIFSGSAFVDGDTLKLYYTGHIEEKLENHFRDIPDYNNPLLDKLPKDYMKQVQCLAESKDGLIFEKIKENPILTTKDIPDEMNLSNTDFRDPNVFYKDGKYYMVVGSNSNDKKDGHAVFFVSLDGVEWKYLNCFGLSEKYSLMWECPDFFELNGKAIISLSPQFKPKQNNSYENIHSSVFLVGHFNYETGEFKFEYDIEIDGGFDFYAPQTIKGDEENTRIMVAWMSMWERTNVLNDLGHNWHGSMTLPREIKLEDGKLYQQPVKTLENYYKNQVKYQDVTVDNETALSEINGDGINLDLEFSFGENKIFEIELFKSETEFLLLKFDKEKNTVTLDRSNTEYLIKSNNRENDFIRTIDIELLESNNIRIVLDVSSAEIFINHGQYVMSSVFYSKNLGKDIVFKGKGVTINNIVKNDIIV